MRIDRRIKREYRLSKVTFKGYSRSMASLWVKKTGLDYKYYSKKYDTGIIDDVHRRGYLCKSIEKYNLLEDKTDVYITDFDYLFSSPYNNSFSKWLSDMITTERVIKSQASHMREIYFSIIQRNGKHLFFRHGKEDRQYTYKDVIRLVRDKRIVELRPAHWLSKRRRYMLEKFGNSILVNGQLCSEKNLISLLNNLPASYVLSESVSLSHEFDEIGPFDFMLKFWCSNNAGPDPEIMFGTANLFYYNDSMTRKNEVHMFDLDNGCFQYKDKTVPIGNWLEIKKELLKMCKDLIQLDYFSASIAVGNDGSFKYLSFSANPFLPEVDFRGKFNDYLKEEAKRKKDRMRITGVARYTEIKNNRFARKVEKNHKGMRPYMQKLWNDAVKNDFLHTRGVSLSNKIWAWRRGFQSFRIKQYGLTEENYKEFLSDRDYYWLNRINNMYQIWVNDKTTFRYTMDPFKDCIPSYYFSIFKRCGKTAIEKMMDCPEDISNGFEGLFEIVRQKEIVAVKPSAGTHGDGFYRMEFVDGKYYMNGEEKSEKEIENVISKFKSFYVVTEYINMHEFIRNIYAKSVNSVRIMAINPNGFDPKIQQCYIRIGSSTTGYTDNIGYGGICAMIDLDTGEISKPEVLVKHEYLPQPNHPDTGTPISGRIPNWDIVKERVLSICRYMPELEYLGFDIAITEDGLQVIEINIHQDLHKVPSLNDEVKGFFKQKIRNKKSLLGIE